MFFSESFKSNSITEQKAKEITSLSNPAIKVIRSLSLKKFRDREGDFLAEGLQLILSGLDSGWHLKQFICAKSALESNLVQKAAARTIASGGDVLVTSHKVMSSITRRDNPQIAIGVFKQFWHTLETRPLSDDSILLALDRIRDPGNLGTIIRTANAAAVSAIFLIGDTTDPFSLEAVRATMGSIFTVPLYKLTEKDFLNWRTTCFMPIIGTHLKGTTDYRKLDYSKRPLLLLMGNEQKGLSDPLAAACDHLVTIPQTKHVDSLNVSVATGIMLYEMQRNSHIS